MLGSLRRTAPARNIWLWLVPAAALLASAIFGYQASPIGLVVPIGIAALLILLRRPLLGLLGLIVVALLAKVSIGTGTEVSLNPAALLIPALFGIWILIQMRDHDLRLPASRTTLPLLLFLIAGLLSIPIGNAIWDPRVPRPDNFTIVQLAQWAIWFFSAAAFWLAGKLVKDVIWLQRLTVCYIAIAGLLAIVRVLPGGGDALYNTVTYAVNRAPFWLLLTALTAGQLLFNRQLSTRWRMFLLIILGAIIVFSFGEEQERASNWVSVAIVAGVLIWLRFPRVRWIVVAAVVVLAISGVLFQIIYDFAGGDAKWEESGGSRLALIGRVIELSMRNPITGIGPAAYRPYGKITSLQYGGAFYSSIWLSSHNNYVDLFSQTGVVGMGLFFWFMLELVLLSARLRKRCTDGFVGGYVNSMLAAWFAVMVIMALADWFMPFVYNIGFLGFQASVLVWMFFGGLVAVEHMTRTIGPNDQSAP